jgi:RNA polymerase sigma factor (sigma-70 family)
MDQNRDLGKSGPAFAQGFTMTALVSTALSGCEPLEVPLSDSRRHAMVLLDGGAFTASTLSHDALATALMDLYRRTRSGEVFDALEALTRQQLLARVRSRVRFIGGGVDPYELLQDAYVNIYRYPAKFDARRPGAFRAWSTTIVDNSVRRYLRTANSGPDIRLKPVEILAQEADEPERGPGCLAIRDEEYREVGRVFQLFLALYLQAYGTLSDRERFVLQMVEVRGLRYAELAKVVEMRAAALKMVVFRARRRIAKRIEGYFAAGFAQSA